MSDVLPEGASELDPNSDAGFNALLARQAGVELSSDKLEELQGSETSVKAGLTFEESAGQPRDEQGRFAPAAPPAEDAQGAAPAEAEAQQEEVDPLVSLAASLLDKHDGDAEAAVAEALQGADPAAQSMIGRQANEMGMLRQELAELRGRLEGYQAAAQQPVPQPVGLPDPSMGEGLSNMVAEHGGPATVSWAANNRPDLIDQAIKAWGEYEPFEAASFRQDYMAGLQIHQAQPANDPVLEDIRLERGVASAIDMVRNGLTDGEWLAVKDHLMPALERAPKMVVDSIVSPDPNVQRDGAHLLVELAKGRVVASAQAEAAKQVAEQSAAVKQATQVATGSLRPVDERQPGGDGKSLTKDEITAEFHKRLLATETTSVRDGLTFGQPFPTG